MIYLQLFLSFLQIGAFSFGGGYAAMPLIQSQVVDLHGWLTMKEFTDLVTIAEMTPGPIALNAATFVGTRIAGTGGALLATFGCILPSCILVPLLAYVYERNRRGALMQGTLAGLRTAVVALIASAALSMLGHGSVCRRRRTAGYDGPGCGRQLLAGAPCHTKMEAPSRARQGGMRTGLVGDWRVCFVM